MTIAKQMSAQGEAVGVAKDEALARAALVRVMVAPLDELDGWFRRAATIFD